MKIIIGNTKLKIVNPTPEQAILLEDLPEKYIVKNYNDVFIVTAPKEKLYELLIQLSDEYDVEII